MGSVEQWLAWNDRQRWMRARFAVIGLGMLAIVASFVLPPIVYPCKNTNYYCQNLELHAWLFNPGALTLLSAIALWMSGKNPALFGVVEGLVLVCVGFYWLFGIGVNDALSMTTVPATVMFLCGLALLVWSVGMLLVRGFAKLRARFQ